MICSMALEVPCHFDAVRSLQNELRIEAGLEVVELPALTKAAEPESKWSSNFR